MRATIEREASCQVFEAQAAKEDKKVEELISVGDLIAKKTKTQHSLRSPGLIHPNSNFHEDKE